MQLFSKFAPLYFASNKLLWRNILAVDSQLNHPQVHNTCLHFEMPDLDVPIYKPLTWIPANSGPTKSPCAALNDFPRVSGIKSEWRPGGQVLGEPRQGSSLLKVSTVGAGDVSCLQSARNKQIWNWSSCSEHWTKITSKQRRLQHRCQPWLPLPIQ